MKKLRLTTAQVAFIMAILTVGGKLLGFIREVFMANYYGAGMITDAYGIASTVPMTLLAGVIAGVATAYMPTLSKTFANEGEKAANLFTSRVLNYLSALTIALIILGAIFSRQLVSVFAPGFKGETFELTAYYLRISFVIIFFNALVYIFESYLQYKQVFNPQIICGYMQNIMVIAFIIISAKTDYHLLILGLVIGFALRGLGDLFVATRNGFKYSFDWEMSGAVKEAVLLALPIFAGSCVNQINTFIDRMLASGLEEGSVSALNYGNMIVNTIVMFTATIMVTIVYPRLNKAFLEEDYAKISHISERGINILLILAVPCTLGAMLYAKPAISFVYERGAFDASDTLLTASAFFFYSLGLSFLCLNQLITRVYYSLHDTKTALYCSAIAVAFNISLNLILVGKMAHAGLALATSVAQMINAFALIFSFSRRHPEIKLIGSVKKPALIVLLSAISVGLSYLVYLLFSGIIICSQFIALAGAVMSACIIYLALMWVFKFDELNVIKDLFSRA